MKKRYTKPLTTEELLQLRDEEIDTSDIPDLDEAWFKNAEVVIQKRKKSVTLRLDEQILDYFQAQGKGYQTRINAILARFVEAQRSTSS